MRAQSVQQSYANFVGVVASFLAVVLLGEVGKGQGVDAATIPLDSITLGAVIQINGQNFVKIGDNRYLSICGIESNKCQVEGQKWDDTAGKCVCANAHFVRQNWTGCSSLATWTEGVSEPDNTNTVCLLDSQGSQLYQAHKYSDGKCYLTTSNSDTLEPLVDECPTTITNGYNASTGKCNCKSGFTLSPSGICYNASSTHVGTGICTNPTAYMQDWDGCSGLAQWTATATSGTTACLSDNRDGKTYMVRRLPDGRCWMVNNLAYGASDKYNGTDVCLDRETMTNANTVENIQNTFGGQSNSTTAYNLWGDCRGTKNVADANRDGYYYNWAAAMQQTNTWCDSSDQPANQTNVQGLCPEGWVLPTGGTGNSTDFQKLAAAINGTYAANYSDSKTYTFFNNSSYGWHGLYSGYTNYTGGLGDQGSNAYYWSSTFYGAGYAYALYFSSSNVSPKSSYSRSHGFSIRCLRN